MSSGSGGFERAIVALEVKVRVVVQSYNATVQELLQTLQLRLAACHRAPPGFHLSARRMEASASEIAWDREKKSFWELGLESKKTRRGKTQDS